MLCPKCGSIVKSINTKYGIRNQCCDLWSWGDAELVDAFTHHARKQAHDEFDRLWKSGTMSRTEAYRWLAETLNIPFNKCHIKLFNESQCFDVEALAKKKYRQLKS